MILTETNGDRVGNAKAAASAIHDVIAVLEGAHPVPPRPDLQMVVQGNLTAVLATAANPAARAAQSLRQHLAAAATHDALQAACMTLAPLLPVRLDTSLTADGAARCLVANRPVLTQWLDRHAGMAQMQLRVGWQPGAALARFGTAEALPHIARRLSAAIAAAIAPIAVAVSPLPVTGDLLWNGIILMRLQDLRSLDRALTGIRGLWPEGISLHQTGPDPVRAFAMLDLSSVSPAQIDQALQTFGLPDLSALAQLPARRRKMMMESGFNDGALRAEIQDQAEILAAAARLAPGRHGFALCRIGSGSRTAPSDRSLAVA